MSGEKEKFRCSGHSQDWAGESGLVRVSADLRVRESIPVIHYGLVNYPKLVA